MTDDMLGFKAGQNLWCVHLFSVTRLDDGE